MTAGRTIILVLIAIAVAATVAAAVIFLVPHTPGDASHAHGIMPFIWIPIWIPVIVAMGARRRRMQAAKRQNDKTGQ